MKQASTSSKVALCVCKAAAALTLCSTSAWAALPTSYSGVKLALTSGYFSDLNNLGQVAGVAYDPATGTQKLALTGANGLGLTLVDSSSANGTQWFVQGLSDQGNIVGTLTTVGGASSGFFTGTNAQGLTTLNSGAWANTTSAVVAISDQGIMVATRSSTPGSLNHHVSKDGGGTWTPLTFSGYANVTAINDAGQMALDLGAGPSSVQAAITDTNGANPQKLGILGYTSNTIGQNPGSRAVDINATGQVAGSSTWTGEPTQHAFITAPGGSSMTDLGTPKGLQDKGYEYVLATALNDQGQVAGHTGQLGLGEAFVTDADGQNMRSLNELLNFKPDDGVRFTAALDINNSGQILVQGYGGVLYLLTPSTLAPIPEASTVAYMALGLLGIGVAARRKL
jgi:probable HAF family extracellular repeat protein